MRPASDYPLNHIPVCIEQIDFTSYLSFFTSHSLWTALPCSIGSIDIPSVNNGRTEKTSIYNSSDQRPLNSLSQARRSDKHMWNETWNDSRSSFCHSGNRSLIVRLLSFILSSIAGDARTGNSNGGDTFASAVAWSYSARTVSWCHDALLANLTCSHLATQNWTGAVTLRPT